MTQDDLKKVLIYKPETGEFFWKEWKNGRRKSLKAGFKMRNGYIGIGINGRQFYAHRLAVLYMMGYMPDGDVDHRDSNGLNNRWDNLRCGTHGQNMQNQQRARSNNKLGVLGVCFDKSRGKFKATIHVDGKIKNLGRFATVEEASAAYVEAKRRHHDFCEI